MPSTVLPAVLERLDDVNGFIEAFLDEQGCSMKTSMAILTAAEEIFVNIVHYSGSPDVCITLAREDDMIALSFADHGIAFDPLAHTDPDIHVGAEERSIGGLGILMVRRMMDEVYYERVDGQNIFHMKKRIA